MPKRNRRIDVVPVWRDQVDEKLLVLALLGFIDQLAAEQTKPRRDRPTTEASDA